MARLTPVSSWRRRRSSGTHPAPPRAARLRQVVLSAEENTASIRSCVNICREVDFEPVGEEGKESGEFCETAHPSSRLFNADSMKGITADLLFLASATCSSTPRLACPRSNAG